LQRAKEVECRESEQKVEQFGSSTWKVLTKQKANGVVK